MENNRVIYKATNIFNNQVYVGATSKSIQQRKLDHENKAINRAGSSFQEAIGTYGPEAFMWEQIDTASNNSELAEKEAYYIMEFNSKDNGYNSDRGGGIQKTIYRFDENYNFINSYECLNDAAQIVESDKRRISEACINNAFYRGSYWSYNESVKFDYLRDLRKKVVNQLTTEGTLVCTFESVTEASRMTGLSKTCISRCCRGEREQSGGFVWQYGKI